MKFSALAVIFLSFSLLSAQDKKDDKGDVSAKIVKNEDSVTIGGKVIPYEVKAATLVLKKEDGSPRASVFYISYVRDDLPENSPPRPVVFAFNGGPGSSSVWLHLGGIGPRIVPTSPDGTQPLAPPATVKANPFSILDVADLVFIDPVSTGYSRPEKGGKKDEFHGVDEDVNSIADFIRRWTSENERWNSPKFLLGESYGGIRAAGLAQRLQSRYGMNLNGVVMLSSLLDFRTLSSSAGDDILYSVYLPTYASTAHFHKKTSGDRDELVKEANDYAFGSYATLLLKGNQITAAETKEAAAKLAALTGISAEIWTENKLRLDPSLFRKELLKKEGKVLGRFDARTAWDDSAPTSSRAGFDPSYAVAYGTFSTAMLDYLTREIGWQDDKPYEILTGNVHPWNWGSGNNIVNFSSRLANAIRDNPKLRVLIMCGHTDLATPPAGIIHSINHLIDLPAAQRANITYDWYEAGHMFYLNQPDLEKMRQDLVDFITVGS